MRAIASLGCEGAMRAIASSMSPHASCCDSVAAHFQHAATCQPRRNPAVELASTTQRSYGRRHRPWLLALRAAGANQLKPASTTPLSYGRRNRPWHYGHVHATHNEQHRGRWPVHHDQVHALRRGYWPGHHDQAPATHNERSREKRPGRNDEVTATNNERRREQWPEQHDNPPL
jgi:hypothetical protein